MDERKVRLANSGESTKVIDTVVLAFAADPFVRWFFPGAQQYLANMRDFAGAFGGDAFRNDGVFCTEDVAGAALWFRPGIHPDESAVMAVVERSVSSELRSDLIGVLEAMSGYHPEGRHWYLPIIGVDPTCHNRGYGGALMAHVLERVDEEHVPAYLESSNPRNVSLYQRHGFEVTGTIQVGSSPSVVPMVRAAR